MKAVILTKIDSPLEVRDVILSSLKPGQVLVQNLVSGLCGAQLQEISGLKGNAKFIPHLMGHEGCGRVIEIGPGVTHVKPQDKVVMHWRPGNGIDSAFPEYILDGKLITSGKVTTLSEYSIVSENRLTKVPDNISDYFCALLGCGLSTAISIIENDAKVKLGTGVLILGCGGLGLSLIQAAKLLHATPIIGIDNKIAKEKFVAKMGGTFCLADNVADLKGSEFNTIIDTTGNANLISNTTELLADGGRYVFITQSKESIILPNVSKFFSANGKSICFSQGGGINPSEAIPRYVKLFQMGLLNIGEIITDIYSLDNINTAIDHLKSGYAGRIMIDIC